MVENKPATTLVTFLLDRTGSMEAIKDDTIGAFNAYLGTLQKSEELIEFSLVQFDSISVDKLHVNKPVAQVPLLNHSTFQPRGSTPLIDAACRIIDAVDEAVKQRATPPKIVVCIQTDGHENSSTQFTWADLNQRIKDKAALGWQFNFMGAGIDAYEQGRRMGIPDAATVSYDATDPVAARAAFEATAVNTVDYAASRKASVDYSVEQKVAARDRFSERKPAGAVSERKSLVDAIFLSGK
jgi:hypothetical protein